VLPDEYSAIRSADLRPSLGSTTAIRAWMESGGGAWHLSIDTGMSRAGMQWTDVGPCAELIAAASPEGAYTHFHSADTNDGSMDQQLERYRSALSRLVERPRYLHAENSPALERGGRSSWDLVRPGVFLYGIGSGVGATISPEPVASLRARVVEIRTIDDGESVSYTAAWRASGERRIATLGIGYADGYRRSLSNGGVALVRGKRAPIVGIVTMDMVMLDVTGMQCEVGDVATLIGRDGDDLLTVEDVARMGDLLSYELLVGLKLRVPRLYRDG